jgi:hypothetical protein
VLLASSARIPRSAPRLNPLRSNPLLHLAKVVHTSQMPVLKDLMLPLFAIVFFVVRVAMAPFSILHPAFTQVSAAIGF